MFSEKILTAFLFAQGGSETLFTMFLWMGPILILMWFLMIRPQQREEDRRRKMVDSLKKGDKVYTVGGIIGTVYAVDREKKEITLSVDDNAKVKFLISAVAAILSDDDSLKKADLSKKS